MAEGSFANDKSVNSSKILHENEVVVEKGACMINVFIVKQVYFSCVQSIYEKENMNMANLNLLQPPQSHTGKLKRTKSL